jgi:hypothetical protein
MEDGRSGAMRCGIGIAAKYRKSSIFGQDQFEACRQAIVVAEFARIQTHCPRASARREMGVVWTFV